MLRTATLLWGVLLSGIVTPAATSPFASGAKVTVLLFARTDCPITNRYAPELKRIAAEHANDGVRFWLVYPDRTETKSTIERQVAEYGFPGTPIQDQQNDLVRKARATVAPEAAVFDGAGQLVYHGRIDNRWVAPGKSRPQATVHDLEDAIRSALHGIKIAAPETRAVGCALADVR